jgi:hypothetical protein
MIVKATGNLLFWHRRRTVAKIQATHLIVGIRWNCRHQKRVCPKCVLVGQKPDTEMTNVGLGTSLRCDIGQPKEVTANLKI